MNIVNSILTNNPCYKTGRTITVKGLMLHSVGCPQPSAKVFVKSWNNPSFDRACVHAFIDGVTGDVYQTLPWNHRGWHGGGSSNNTHIGVEMCEPSTIKYTTGATFLVENEADAKAVATRTYKSAVELFAKLCADFNLDPIADGVIISHSEGYTKGIASNHADPEHLWKQLNLPYTMNGFRADVKKQLELITNTKNETTNKNKVLYCVQTGAFSVWKNATNMVNNLKNAGIDSCITIKNDSVTNRMLYCVQTGAFTVKQNAINMVNNLKNVGIDACITIKKED